MAETHEKETKEKKNYKDPNHWYGVGRLASDPTFTQKGDKKIAKFTIAVNNGTETPDWIDIVCFAHNAQFSNDYLEKGVKVMIEGRLATSTYEDKDGNKRKSVNIVARSISFAESKRLDNVETSEEVAETVAETKEEQEVQEDLSIPDEFVPTDDESPFE